MLELDQRNSSWGLLEAADVPDLCVFVFWPLCGITATLKFGGAVFGRETKRCLITTHNIILGSYVQYLPFKVSIHTEGLENSVRKRPLLSL